MTAHDHDRIARTLRERSDDMAGSHLGLDDVKGRARSIRRRRRAVTGAAAAVVLAHAEPGGLNVTDHTRGNEPLPTNPSPAPSPSVVETGEPEPVPSGPIPADGAAAPRGEDPAMTYLTGSVVHPPGQEPIDLGRDYAEVTPYGDG